MAYSKFYADGVEVEFPKLANSKVTASRLLSLSKRGSYKAASQCIRFCRQ